MSAGAASRTAAAALAKVKAAKAKPARSNVRNFNEVRETKTLTQLCDEVKVLTKMIDHLSTQITAITPGVKKIVNDLGG